MFFSRKKKLPTKPLQMDIHCHLLPEVDDGVKSFEESIEILTAYKQHGIKKVILTSHIVDNYYPENRPDLETKFNNLQELINEKNLGISLELGAEYYLDENFITKIEKGNLLSFLDNYVLFETSFLNKPSILEEVIFELSSKGYKPILAHPERYTYLMHDENLQESLMDRGVLFQLNLGSLIGIYSKEIKRFAESLIDKGMVHALGTDCHNARQLHMIKDALASKYYKKLSELDLLNFQ